MHTQMKTSIKTTVTIGTAVVALALASASFAQTTSTSLTPEQLAERRAAARQRAEESIRYLNELMAKAQAEAEARRALLPPRPPLDPEAVKVAREKQRYAKRRELARWLFGADGLPNDKGREFFENKAGRERALAASRLAGIRPKINPERLLGRRGTKPSDLPALVVEGPVDGGDDPLYLTDWFYDAQQNLTWFELLLVSAPLNEWWEVYHAPSLQSTAWQLARLGPPDGVSGDVQQFSVAVPGQPQQAYFQIFLNKDSDYDGIPDGYEVAILKTDPLNPDSDSTRDADGNGVPDYPPLAGNNRADGDEDFDGDGLSTIYELTIGTEPLVPQPSTDSDSDGLPDWLESLITFYTGDPSPSPVADSDGDGLNNKSEWAMRLDPSWQFDAVLGNFATLPDDQRVVRHRNLEFQAPAGFGPAAGSNADDAYFDASFGGYFGTAAELIVLKDTDADGNPAPGVDTFKWAVAYQTPPDFVPAQDIPEPDPADGPVEDSDILLQVTDTLSDVWEAAKVTENLDTLAEPTLIHLQQRSFSRMWMRFRTLQLMMVAQELPQGLLLRARAVIGEIHTQATILRKTTLIIGIKYPSTQALARMGRFVPVVGAIASVLSAYNTANELVPVWEQYLTDVWRRCDNNNDTALDLAVGLSSIVDNAFPAPVLTAFLWPIWWDGLSNFDGWDSACF
jgi:hypothetical protein